MLSIDAKDLYDANRMCVNRDGYSVRDADGSLRLKRFSNTIDYSLELIQLRQVYKSVMHNSKFSTHWQGKEYTQQVINVTFKYAYRRWNKTVIKARNEPDRTFFVKAGYKLNDLTFSRCLAFEDDELVGVEVGAHVDFPASDAVLGKVFFYNAEDHTYSIRESANEILKSREDLRHDMYENGFVCDGIKYVRFKRSSGSARVGKCLFINEQLYPKMHRWEKCGVYVRKDRSMDLAAWEAYISLTMSSIIGTVQIRPENILLIDDYESVFKDKVLAIGLDGTWLTANPEETEFSNCIWDGQSLMDTSLFEGFQDRGMLLLRARFFKSACFHTDIQQFFKDHGITDVSQLNGQTRAEKVEDIKLITTPSSLKYLKFGTFDEWLDRLEPDFGIVKHDKPTHFFDGRMVQAHYQLLNTLHMSKEDTEQLLQPTKDYLDKIERYPEVLRHHLRRGPADKDIQPTTVMNDIVFHFLGVNDQFIETKMCHNFKRRLMNAYKSNVKKGHVLIEGTYATLVSNPIEMLLASIGQFNGESIIGKGNVSCSMFGPESRLLGSRSPHVAAGNLLLVNNVVVPEIEKYMHLTGQIVCINCIGENILERLSGADMDSDTILLTDNELLIARAEDHYDDFLVPTKLVPADLKGRKFTNGDKADLDYVTSDNRIGEIVNLSQELNSLFWDRLNEGAKFEDIEDIYCDIAKLDVLSNIEIDRAKRECVVDSVAEMKKIRAKYSMLDKNGRKIKPFFFAHIARAKGYYDAKRNYYKHHKTTMDYVQEIVSGWHWKKKTRFLPLGEVFQMRYYAPSRVDHDKSKSLIKMLRETNVVLSGYWAEYRKGDSDERTSILRRIREVVENRTEYVKSWSISPTTIYYLTQEIEKKEYDDVRQTFFNVLFGNPSHSFRELIRESRDDICSLIEDPNGEVNLYGYRFKRENRDT